jgi:hypothetical protein
MTGLRTASEGLLGLAMLVCFAFSAYHLGLFAYSHTPPYKVGQCLAVGKTPITYKINENHVLEGYSDGTVMLFEMSKDAPVPFVEQRREMVPVECK